MTIDEILKKLDVEIEDRDETEEGIVHYCSFYKDKRKMPFIIIEDFEDSIMLIRSLPIGIKREKNNEVLQIINEENSENIYGTIYIDEEFDVIYDIGQAANDRYKYEFESIKGYIEELYKNIIILIYKFKEKDLLEDYEK